MKLNDTGEIMKTLKKIYPIGYLLFANLLIKFINLRRSLEERSRNDLEFYS